MKSKTLRTAADIIENTLRPFDQWEMSRYLQAKALNQAVFEARKDLDFSIQSACWPHDIALGAVANDLAARADSPAGRKLAALLAAKDVFDHCPELAEITAKLDPIFEELETAQARESKQAAEELAAKRATESAKAEALAKAQAEIEAQFATA